MAGKQALTIDNKQVVANMESIEKKARAVTYIQMEEWAKIMEAYAKRNRPWTDRTTHARQRLKGYVEKNDNMVRVGVAHGVDYGTHLELEHEKRYAILKPTLERFTADILKSFNWFLSKVRI